MLNKYHISVVKEEMERVDTLRFQYGNLQSKAVSFDIKNYIEHVMAD